MLPLLIVGSFFQSRALAGAFVLQEMSWVEVGEYLKENDMIIIPLGSTEQHGPHLPLGSDYYQAFEISKKISERTGVIVAPILMVGYSEYHAGFPGVLSIKPETMTQVLFESIEFLIEDGFRRIMFMNGHGGNAIVQENLIHRINQTTEAVAVALDTEGTEEEYLDWHSGKTETSKMLYLMPSLVRMEKAEKPTMRFTARMERLQAHAKNNPELDKVFTALLGTREQTKKGGASHEFSSNGIWTLSDLQSVSEALGKQNVDIVVDKAVKFIEAWREAE